MSKESKTCWGIAAGLLGGYILTQQAWALWQLIWARPEETLKKHANRAPQGRTFAETVETDTSICTHTVEDGIERIVYTPKNRRFETPILMQHGMWHGAWCWALWQELFAQWGWESHAHSLPGHAGSAMQRPIARCTLDYYLGFLQAELERLPRRPVLIGHSMGGALTQWCLKYVTDDLPAAVLVAPWVSHSMFGDGLWPVVSYDPLVAPLMMASWDATPMARQGKGSTVRFLVGSHAAIPLDKLQPQLGPESALVLYQHNPPFWYPPTQVRTPMLWIAGEDDPLLLEKYERRSAAHYGADYIVARQARHNVMMEHNYRETARQVHDWLVRQGIR